MNHIGRLANVDLFTDLVMEQFVLNVQTLSGQGNFHELADYLSKSMEMLDRNSGQLSNVLETLDIQQHSLGVLAVRYNRIVTLSA